MSSTHVPYPESEGTAVPRIKYVGVMFTEYTPQVESQLLRDCLALLDVGRSCVDEVVVCCESDKPDQMLNGLGMRRIPTGQLAKLWLVYKTEEYWPDAPEWSTETVQRDLWTKPGSQRLTVLDDAHTNGYYLPPQGRLCPDTLSLERPAPNGYIPTDPALFVLWGS